MFSRRTSIALLSSGCGGEREGRVGRDEKVLILMLGLPEREHVNPTVECADSALGRWMVARWTPPIASRLSSLVERIWYFDGTMVHAKERVFPDGRAEIIVMLDEPHRDGDAETLPTFPAVCINGLRTRPSVVVAPPGRCRVLGILFEPLAACRLLHESLADLTDTTIDLRDAIGRAADELGNRCADGVNTSAWNPARNAVAVVRTAAEWAMDRVSEGPMVDPTIHWAACTIRSDRGVLSVNGIGSALRLSRSQFAERFRSRVGVTPKRFARIVRFQNALSMLGQVESIASVAAELSYYDQAHMHRDFGEFAGMTPGAFVAARRYAGSSSVAE